MVILTNFLRNLFLFWKVNCEACIVLRMTGFVEMENIARKFRLQINQEKTNYMIVERKNSLNKNKIGHLKIKKLQIWKSGKF